jgi:hypothetical protein
MVGTTRATAELRFQFCSEPCPPYFQKPCGKWCKMWVYTKNSHWFSNPSIFCSLGFAFVSQDINVEQIKVGELPQKITSTLLLTPYLCLRGFALPRYAAMLKPNLTSFAWCQRSRLGTRLRKRSPDWTRLRLATRTFYFAWSIMRSHRFCHPLKSIAINN